MTDRATTTTSVRGFARRLGVAPSAVRLAARSGRLSDVCVGRNSKGHLTIKNEVLALSEWEAHTRVRIDSRRIISQHVDTMPPAYLALGELVALLATIEKRLSAVLEGTVEQLPDMPATAWQALYAEWERLPDALELLQRELLAAHAAEPRPQHSEESP